MNNTQTVIQSYLFLGGRCEEALTFYQQALGAKLEMKMRFSESPDPVPEGMLPPGFADKIMHSELSIGQTRLMLSDGCDQQTAFQGFSLAMLVADEAEAHRCFNALADGGQVRMPLMKTFWSPCYGQVADRFGVAWMVMVPGQQVG